MKDKTALGISEELRQFIEALVEEVVLEGKSFESQKKYLSRFCQAEGIDYNLLEKNLSDLFETAEELKTHESKASERFLRLLGKECYLSNDEMENIILAINIKRRAEEDAWLNPEAEEHAKAERKAQEEVKKAQEEAERERKAREAAERKAEAERKAREERERKAQEEAERQERERKAREDAEFHEQFKKQWEKMMPSWYKNGLK